MRALVTDGTGLLGNNLVRALPPHEKQPHWHAGAIYRNIVTKYGRETGINIEVNGLCVHSLRAAATKALSNEADITKVQEWPGHANVSAPRVYDRRKSKPEDSPTFHVKY